MDRFTWYLKQLVPHTIWTAYYDESGTQHFSIWKMWLGRCYDVLDVRESVR